ncbi:TRAP transporter large permease subunit [Rhodovulum sulfidophilum]|uniref:TRAP transporter large permease subunit n=1 Tax=Rhodovulum sulfidophilum TaxID=35806 RepID=UPI00192418E8|nr:TRAP transporter large permease subunit [Rhodovulum sulfidophilum]MBL3573187.1 TRAP transporter large permease subunit [Rhodovulum sulfidophilum]MCE8432905.1 TRAP transporter large permease subunit [Rhodovulum sulfidophilum]MCF4115899.1 TRAP transporter large permease subunit [Rhodovulum sulfidophilum]
MTSLLVVIGLLGLLLLGVPVGFALAFTGLVGLMTIVGFDSALSVLSTTPLSTTNGFELIAVPLFILMADGMPIRSSRWIVRRWEGATCRAACAGACHPGGRPC